MIDCHQDWCGPCETLAPLFNGIYMDTQDAEKRLMLLTVSARARREKWRAGARARARARGESAAM